MFNGVPHDPGKYAVKFAVLSNVTRETILRRVLLSGVPRTVSIKMNPVYTCLSISFVLVLNYADCKIQLCPKRCINNIEPILQKLFKHF